MPPATPPLTVDIIIQTADGIVLIDRGNEPPGWALPGGFVDIGESLENAARREAGEETGLQVTLLRQFQAYSDPTRDPRGPTVSVVFLAMASGTPVGGDDARRAAVFSLGGLPTPLAFDHGRIINDYIAFCRGRPIAEIFRDRMYMPER